MGLYPTDEELNKIETWDYKLGWKSLIEYIERLWWMPDWGFKLSDGRTRLFRHRCKKLQLHTAGWSGNEDIIESLRKNFMFWSMCFYKHIRGGHFWFEIKNSLFSPTHSLDEEASNG